MTVTDFVTWMEGRRNKSFNYGPATTDPKTSPLQPTSTAATEKKPDVWTQGSQEERMKLGKQAEQEIIMHLMVHGIKIEPANDFKTDAYDKIDGFLNGEPVQIKTRRSGKAGRNDIAYEVLRGHNRRQPVMDQLQNRHSQGRDYKGTKVVHYFIQNQDNTAIYHVRAADIKNAVDQALGELDANGGILDRPFEAGNGVQLRPTTDRGASHMSSNMRNPNKVMAFIPVERVAIKTYPIRMKRA